MQKSSKPPKGDAKMNMEGQKYIDIRIEQLQNKIRSKDDMYRILHDYRKQLALAKLNV